MITSRHHAGHRGRPVRPGLRAIMVVTATAAVATAAAMVPAAALASGGGRAAAAGHPARAVAAAGVISTVAGGGTDPGDGGPATAAALGASSVRVDGAGNLVIADGINRIRVVAARTGTFYGQAMTVRHIYTVAGNGTTGFSGDGGPATNAE